MIILLLVPIFSLTVGSLEQWLFKNGALLPSSIGHDVSGLRGLRSNHQDDSEQVDSLCASIPRKCLIVANDRSSNKNVLPIDKLAATLLYHIRLGEKSEYSSYIKALPSYTDLSMAGIAASWSDKQIDRLLHQPTKDKFQKMRSSRDIFIKRNAKQQDENDKVITGWAHDLTSSRAMMGPFGRHGKVRASLIAIIFSSLVLPLQLIVTASDHVNAIALLPFATSLIFLVANLVNDEPEIAMVPWLDIANHKTGSRLTLEYNFFSDHIMMKGSSQLGPDGMLTYDYGGVNGYCNDILLSEYGFIERNNVNDCITLEISTDESVTIRRFDLLKLSDKIDCTDTNKQQRLVVAAQKTRDILTVGQAKPCEEPIDDERSKLATEWRNEKIKLLNEFLEQVA